MRPREVPSVEPEMPIGDSMVEEIRRTAETACARSSL